MKISLAIFVMIALAATGLAQCPVPQYRVGRDYSNSTQGSLYVSVRARDFDPASLVCLAHKLKARHPNWKGATILFFNSHDAALDFRLPGQECQASCRKSADQLHAVYHLDQATQEEGLDILPAGFDSDTSLGTSIKIPIEDALHCRLQMNGRCLVALESPKLSKRCACVQIVWHSGLGGYADE